MLNRYLEKIAKTAEGTKDRPHHIRALKKLEETGGLLADHSMGSGKTRLYLRAIQNYQEKNTGRDALVIAPASLVSNIYKEIEKHKIPIDTKRLETLSYEKATIDSKRLLKKDFGIVVADEGHKLRNTGTARYKQLSHIINGAEQRLIGSGTTAYNKPSDIAPLVNLAAGTKVLPEGRAFEKSFITTKKEAPPLLRRILGEHPKEVQVLKNTNTLRGVLNKYVDRYDIKDDPSAKDKFPTKIETTHEVEMSAEQEGLYKYMEGKLPYHLRIKVRMNLPLDKRDTASLQAFSSGVRQVSNSVQAFMPNSNHVTPKVHEAAEQLHSRLKKDKNFRGIIYSNYLGAGVKDYSDELTARGIDHLLYHGGMSSKEKDEAVEEYNNGKKKVMIISSAGAEGLNTKGTKLVQVMEPHFNASKIDQVVARAVRYESHEHLPKNERFVEVQHYHSVLPHHGVLARFTKRPTGIDTYLAQNSKTKDDVTQQLKALTKQKQ